MPFRKRARRAKKAVGSKLNPRQKRQVKTLMGRRMENKYSPFYFENTSVSNLGTITDINNIAQGDTGITRDGQQIYLKQVKMRMIFVPADTTNVVRAIVVQWHDDDTQAPTVADVLENPTNVPFLSPIKYFSRKFAVLRDVTVGMTLASTGVRYVDVNIFGKRLNKKVSFNSSSTKGKNHIYVLLISDSGATPYPSFSASGYLKYNDC